MFIGEGDNTTNKSLKCNDYIFDMGYRTHIEKIYLKKKLRCLLVLKVREMKGNTIKKWYIL